ncbi:MAG TPA: phytanoyl-CoA dioxygenase family protein [Chloroflexota bacterium]|nr:phytanoyl-CoA dioxygenase family protein [Chloroflexota bacterium]
MELTAGQQEQLIEEGYVRLPGAVPADLVARARRAINASLGERGIDPEQLPIYRARSYCPELQHDSVITDLYNASKAREIAEAAIGPGKVRQIGGGQIALRFPTMSDPRPPHPHIDGMYTPTNGVPPGTIANFTALVGVFLSEIPHDDMGNFSVWPGSHRTLQAYFREHGPQSLLEGFPPVELGEPLQLHAAPGDAVLCHYQLAHGIAGNGSPFVRYGIFFRLAHVEHESVHWECMTDIWREWEGISRPGTLPGGTG